MKKVISFFVALIIVCATTAFVLLPVVRNGLEISSDSVIYINGSQNIVKGLGFSFGCGLDTSPIVHWAPFYSVMIAILQFIGFSWSQATRILAAIIYAGTGIGIFIYLQRFTNSILRSTVVLFSFLLYTPILQIVSFAGSDAFQWIILILFSSQLIRTLVDPKDKNAILLGFIGGIGLLNRFAFAGFLVGSILSMTAMIRTHGLKKVIRVAFLTSITCGLIFGPWLARNFILTGSILTGGGGNYDLFHNLIYSILRISDLVFHKIFSGTLLNIISAGFMGILALLGVYCFLMHKKKTTSLTILLIWCNLMLLAGYLATIILLRTYADPITIDERMFSPTLILLLLIFAGVSLLPVSKKNHIRRDFIVFLPMAFFLLATVYFLPSGYDQIVHRDKGYLSFENSSVIQAVVEKFPQEQVTTPDYSPFVLWKDYCPLPFPRTIPKPIDAVAIQQVRPVLVLFDHSQKKFVVTDSDIVWNIPFQELSFMDGRIFLFEPRN